MSPVEMGEAPDGAGAGVGWGRHSTLAAILFIHFAFSFDFALEPFPYINEEALSTRMTLIQAEIS